MFFLIVKMQVECKADFPSERISINGDIFLITVQLICNVILVSGKQNSFLIFLQIIFHLSYYRASPVAQTVKILLQHWRPGFDPWAGKIPRKRVQQLTQVFLPGVSTWTISYIVPYILVSYLFYTYQSLLLNTLLLSCPSLCLSSIANHQFAFCIHESMFVLLHKNAVLNILVFQGVSKILKFYAKFCTIYYSDQMIH